MGGSDDPTAKVNPLDGVLVLRKELGLFANLRSVKVSPVLSLYIKKAKERGAPAFDLGYQACQQAFK